METSSEQRLKHILSSSPVVTYVCSADAPYNLTFVSDNITSFLGYTVDECLQWDNFWRTVIHHEDHPHVFDGCDNFFKSGHEAHDYRLLKKDGAYVWVHDEMKLVRDDHGVPVEIIGSWLDISDRRSVEEALEKSELLFRAFFESNPIPTIITTPAGLINMVNPSFTVTTGYSWGDVVGKTSQEMGFWRDISDRERMVTAVQEHGHIDNMEARFYGKNNRAMTCLVSSRAVEYGGEIRMLSTVIDVTEQRRAEEEQRKSEQLFRDLFEINPVGTIVTNPEGTIYLVNPAFVNASGYAFDEMVGKTVHELGFWKNEEDRRQMLAAIKDKGYLDNLEATMYGNHGKQFVCLISSRLIEFGGEVRILNLVTDITEQRAAEETLRRIEKAKSDFISIAAHELRTPLIAVIGYCELLQNATQGNISDEQREEYLEVVQSNAETLNRLVDDLLDIGRIQIGRTLGVSPQETDLLSLVEKTVASVKLRSGSHEIIIKKAEGLPEKVWLDPGRIAQVLYNLLSNAIKFSPDGGIIQVHLESFQNHLSVSVVDRGLGMNEEEIENIFDRFYRGDKGSAESPGLGLGLSIVKQIITDHGGDIQVESQPGKGTTVKFSLPVET